MRRWTRVSEAIANFLGSGKALLAILSLVVAWLVWGAVAAWSRAWEVTMYAGAPILTLVLIVFLQHTQNRDSRATQVKLNALLVALEHPGSEAIAAERKADDELERLAHQQEKAAGSGA